VEVGIAGGDPDLDAAILVALGSNLAGGYASPEALLEEVLRRFPGLGLSVQTRSRWWRSAAWPDASEPAFLNGVAWVETGLGPFALLERLRQIESAFGRDRLRANAPRTLDLDLIAHGRHVIAGPDLSLPHPRAHARRFVMGPLADVAPHWRHPGLGLTAANLADQATVGLDAKPLDP
jgi:2-amino-4-hydroxy-6-hydroxymethyldihydropteridine diphosphokinase